MHLKYDNAIWGQILYVKYLFLWQKLVTLL